MLGLAVVTGCAGQYGREHDPPAFSRAVPAIAKPMAQLAGAIKLRRGRLTGRDEIRTALQRKLRPFDIVFLSAPYKGTSLFIPGHFSHVGVWLGEESDWKGVNLPLPLYSALASRRSFFHVDRAGARFSDVDEILDADRLTIMRLEENFQIHEIMKRINALNTRKYDFNFDGVDRTYLLCTELVIELFDIRSHYYSNFLGRLFVTPDQLLQTFMENGAAQTISVTEAPVL